MRTLIAAAAATAGSVAFQASIALFPNALQHYAWAVKYVWMLSAILWAVWFISHPGVRNFVGGRGSTESSKQTEVSDRISVQVNPVFTNSPVFSPVQSNSQASYSPSAPISAPKSRLCIGEPRVAAVGYDVFGVWGEWIGDLEGIVIEVSNPAGEKGETVAKAENLVVSIGARSTTLDRPNLVSRAYWLRHEVNEIDLAPGEKSDVLLAVREHKHEVLSFYENRKRVGPIYIGRRRPLPRISPNIVPIGTMPTMGGVKLRIKVLYADRGETLLSKRGDL